MDISVYTYTGLSGVCALFEALQTDSMLAIYYFSQPQIQYTFFHLRMTFSQIAYPSSLLCIYLENIAI